MKWLSYFLMAMGVALALAAAAIYSHSWTGFNNHTIGLWKVCAGFSFLLILVGFFFAKSAGNKPNRSRTH